MIIFGLAFSFSGSTSRHLQEIIDADGPDAFKKIEEAIVLAHDFHNSVIATGESVVYSRKAVEHLKADGTLVYLKITFAGMERRLKNITTRGIVLRPGQTLRDLYDEWVSLYEQYVDITIDCNDEHFEEIVRKILEERKKIRA